ncbi:hypothetical protein B0H19DRAFT_1074486 [Mycena capillaripes]|nr:hypothetical protein B0H19DRAFT_1074486 [Mycena capillaripes]
MDRGFIDFAIGKGVKRFVLMSAGLLEAGGPGMSLVHQYLASLNIDYCVLRPSFFFGSGYIHNFLLIYSDAIRASNEVVSATEDGLIGHISTEDIAEVAFKALVDDMIENPQPILVGPRVAFLRPERDAGTVRQKMSAADVVIAEGGEEAVQESGFCRQEETSGVLGGPHRCRTMAGKECLSMSVGNVTENFNGQKEKKKKLLTLGSPETCFSYLNLERHALHQIQWFSGGGGQKRQVSAREGRAGDTGSVWFGISPARALFALDNFQAASQSQA